MGKSIGRYFRSMTVQFMFWFLSSLNGCENHTYQTLGFTDHTYASAMRNADRFVMFNTDFFSCSIPTVWPGHTSPYQNPWMQCSSTSILIRVHNRLDKKYSRDSVSRYRNQSPQRGSGWMSKYSNAFQIEYFAWCTNNGKGTVEWSETMFSKIHKIMFGNRVVANTELSESTEVSNGWLRGLSYLHF